MNLEGFLKKYSSMHFHSLLIFYHNVSTNPQSYKFKYFYSSKNLTIVWPLVIIDPNVASLSHGPFASSLAFVSIGSSTLSFIDPNLEHNENVVISLIGSPCLLEEGLLDI
jgi:hypothetical protein